MQNGNACKMAMYFCILIYILPYICAKFSAKWKLNCIFTFAIFYTSLIRKFKTYFKAL